jgi:hypothetical protein
MTQYFQVSDYLANTRSFLQDLIGPPYRYADADIVFALNTAVAEISRLRPDLFLEYKYQHPLPRKSYPDDLVPGLFTSTRTTDVVPIPRTYYQPTIWYMAGLLQAWDVDDTQDVRAQMFSQKFVGALTSLVA